MAVFFSSGEIFASDKLKLEVFFEEESSCERIEVSGHEIARKYDDAYFSHIDR
jgi:hypothetical protein